VASLSRQPNFEIGRERDRVARKEAGICNNNARGSCEFHIFGCALQSKTSCLLHADLIGQDVSVAAGIEISRVLPPQATGETPSGDTASLTDNRVLETLTEGEAVR
jgi:hypothetical protein